MADTSGNPSFFDPQLNSYRPGLEPPGFDILRELLIRQIIGMKQNPYGMSPAGAQNINGPLFSSGLRSQPSLGYMNQGSPAGQGGGGLLGAAGGLMNSGQLGSGAGQGSSAAGLPGSSMASIGGTSHGRMPPTMIGPPHRPPGSGIGRMPPSQIGGQQPRQGWFWDLLNQIAGRGTQAGRTSMASTGPSFDGWVDAGYGTGPLNEQGFQWQGSGQPPPTHQPPSPPPGNSAAWQGGPLGPPSPASGGSAAWQGGMFGGPLPPTMLPPGPGAGGASAGGRGNIGRFLGPPQPAGGGAGGAGGIGPLPPTMMSPRPGASGGNFGGGGGIGRMPPSFIGPPAQRPGIGRMSQQPIGSRQWGGW